MKPMKPKKPGKASRAKSQTFRITSAVIQASPDKLPGIAPYRFTPLRLQVDLLALMSAKVDVLAAYDAVLKKTVRAPTAKQAGHKAIQLFAKILNAKRVPGNASTLSLSPINALYQPYPNVQVGHNPAAWIVLGPPTSKNPWKFDYPRGGPGCVLYPCVEMIVER